MCLEESRRLKEGIESKKGLISGADNGSIVHCAGDEVQNNNKMRVVLVGLWDSLKARKVSLEQPQDTAFSYEAQWRNR